MPSSSTLTEAIYLTIDAEKARYQKIYHTMFAKVHDRLKQEIPKLQRKGQYRTVLKVPCVLTSMNSLRCPPQHEVTKYICGQLQRRGFTILSANNSHCEVDWSYIVKDNSAETQDITGNAEEGLSISSSSDRSDSENEAETSVTKPTRGTMLPPPPTNSLPPLKAKGKLKTAKHNGKATTSSSIGKVSKTSTAPVKTTKLNAAVERRIAQAHQAVLRALAGV